jgi:hypothetical protein
MFSSKVNYHFIPYDSFPPLSLSLPHTVPLVSLISHLSPFLLHPVLHVVAFHRSVELTCHLQCGVCARSTIDSDTRHSYRGERRRESKRGDCEEDVQRGEKMRHSYRGERRRPGGDEENVRSIVGEKARRMYRGGDDDEGA